MSISDNPLIHFNEIREAATRLKTGNYSPSNKLKRIKQDFETVRNSGVSISQLVPSQPDASEADIKHIANNIPPNIADRHRWEKAFVAAAMKSSNPNIVLIGKCVYNGSDHGSSETIPASILKFTQAQRELGRINDFDESELLRLSRVYASELSNFQRKLSVQQKQITEAKEAEEKRINSLPIGTELPLTGKPQAARQGLAESDHVGGDKESHLRSSILNSKTKQIIKTYSAAGIKEWEKDIKLIDDHNYSIDEIVQKLSSSENSFAAELKNVCIDVVKEKPTYVIQDIVRNLYSVLHLSEIENDTDGAPIHFVMPEENKIPYLNLIKEKIDLYKISGKDLMQAIMQPILYPEKGYCNGGVEHMNSGTPKFDVERFSKLLKYLEQVSGYKPDIEQVSNAILEKSLSKFAEKDGLFGLPLTENIVYLTELPKELNIDIKNSYLVKRYGQAGCFDLALITTLNRAIKTGGGITGAYNPEYMTMFCNQYQDYLNFDNTTLETFINFLKERDETGQLSKHTAKEILLDKDLGKQLYLQVSKYGSPGDLPLINSIRELTGKAPFWLENTD